MTRLFLLFFLFAGCQSTPLLKSVKDLKNSICLNSRGKGRIFISGHKQVFSYQSYYDEENLQLDLDLTFPIYGTESVSVNYIGEDARFEIDSSFEKRLLREQKDVNPELVDKFLNLWGEFFEDIIHNKKLIKKDLGIKLNWDKSSKSLTSSTSFDGYGAKFNFLYLSSDGYFERMDIETIGLDEEETVKLELIVRKCLEKQTEELN